MLIKSKLEEFKASPDKIKRYRDAIRTLQAIGVDQVLAELALPDPVSDFSSGSTEPIAALYQSLGYQKCLAQLFELDQIKQVDPRNIIADFGANEKLGISADEASKFAGALK